MRPPVAFFGIVYFCLGLFFALNSASRSSSTETHWGFALTGLLGLYLGARFLGLPRNRDIPPGKLSKPDPFE